MIGIEWPRRKSAFDAFLGRVFFQGRLATGLLVTTIMLWYLVQIAALFVGWDIQLLRWMFTTESFPELSPGLFFAILSHQFPPRITHLFGNVALLWLFAGESEQHMSRKEVVGFFVVTALSAVLVGTGVSGDSTMGASGGVLAFVCFYCVHMILEHRDQFKFDALTAGGLIDTPLRAYWGLILVLTPLVAVPYMLGQLVGIVPVGRANVVGHLTGFLYGMGYAVVRTSYQCVLKNN